MNCKKKLGSHTISYQSLLLSTIVLNDISYSHYSSLHQIPSLFWMPYYGSWCVTSILDGPTLGSLCICVTCIVKILED